MKHTTNLKTYKITFDDFYDMVDSICDIKIQEEIKDFYGDIYNPSDYTIEDYVNSIATRAIQDLILFLEDNGADAFEILMDNGNIILYKPEELESDIPKLFEIIGEEIFYRYAEEWVDEITLIYAKYISGEELEPEIDEIIL